MSANDNGASEPPRRERDQTALVLEAAGVAELEWDVVRDTFLVSHRLAMVTGLPSGRVPARGGAALLERVHPDDVGAICSAIHEELLATDRCSARFRIMARTGGAPVWLDARGLAIRSKEGVLIRVIGAVRDVSDEKAESEQRDALVAELDHRVKNVLASVQSLAAQSARRTVSLDAFLKTFFGRLDAMVAAHTLLTATRWRGVEISQVAAAELGGLARGQARWGGDDLILTARATHALTLALHELSANAVKHGALSTDAGRVEVSWFQTDNGGFELVWTESGGPIVYPPTRRGFGSTLLERVTARELGGSVKLDFRPEGLRAVLGADANALARLRRPEPNRLGQNADTPQEAGSNGGTSQGVIGEADIHGVRVFIVEDAVLLALELESGLSACGAVVTGMAASLNEAMAMVGEPFDVAVLDANLDGRSVAPVARALIERSVPFIFATGQGDTGAAPPGFNVPVVRKPYNIRQIAAALALALEARTPGSSALD